RDRREGRGTRKAARSPGAAAAADPPGDADVPGLADRGQRGARTARARAAAPLRPAGAGRAARGDLVPLARGPAGEELLPRAQDEAAREAPHEEADPRDRRGDPREPALAEREAPGRGEGARLKPPDIRDEERGIGEFDGVFALGLGISAAVLAWDLSPWI